MHKGKQAIVNYLHRNGYEATYLGTDKICVAGKVIKTMREAIEFLLAQGVTIFPKRRKA